jgi:superfamily I DNA/RNA helicase
VAGVEIDEPDSSDEYEWIVTKGAQAYALGFGERYDAVLVDEGQDFTLEWWQLLRDHVRKDATGEMLLVADPTQDIYGTAGVD